MFNSKDYSYLLQTAAGRQWKITGTDRRAGVNVPLFSLYSDKSTGIGEFPDLKLLIDWCRKTGMSLIQLLPLNDAGSHFAPYNADSSFALDPMYLSLDSMPLSSKLKKEVAALKLKYPANKKRVDYKIKKAKLNILRKIFREQSSKKIITFDKFSEDNRFWLEDYVLFKALKEKFKRVHWNEWPEEYRNKDTETIGAFIKKHEKEILFEKWLQWQAFTQLSSVKKYAEKKGALLMGDLPFLVSGDSADVWAAPHFFKLHRVAGAPPDLYFAKGQRWGMPPYDWSEIKKDSFSYLRNRLRYAENFYHLYRVDHSVGLFRVWTIDVDEPHENYGLNGKFDPEDESVWEEHGRKLLSVMLEASSMLPCAEDLGTIPECSFRVLEDFGIPGTDVARWMKDWGKSYDFLPPKNYRKTGLSTLSTHDMTSFCLWWHFEAGTVDRLLFERKARAIGISEEQLLKPFDLKGSRHQRLRWKEEICSDKELRTCLGINEKEGSDLIDLYHGSFREKIKYLRYLGKDPKKAMDLTKELVIRAIEKLGSSASIFTVLLLQDWLSIGGEKIYQDWDFRINTPGTIGKQNWTLRMPLSLNKMLSMKYNKRIAEINKFSNRR